MNYKYKFTVFTPTYNRASSLSKVFESLKKQSYKNFEWLIIDDGSTDNTEAIVEKWKKNSDFEIRYFKKENGGKHTAYNFGVPIAQGELLLTLDSDDSCVSEALEVFNDVWENIDNKEEFSAITANCFDKKGDIIGTPFPEDVVDSDSIEIRYRHKVKGEKWGFQKTEIMLAHPFPEPPNLKLILENIIWDKISTHYKTRFINKNLRLYETSDDSYTVAKPQKFAYSMVLSKTSTLNNCIQYLKYDPFEFFKTCVHYIRFSLHSKSSLFSNLNNNNAKLLAIIAYPFGVLVYIKDLIVHKKQ